MFFIDTHTHLFVKEFEDDRDTIISEAIHSGVAKMILPGINSSSYDVQYALTEKYPKNCFIAAGLHPSDVKEDYENELRVVEEQLNTGKFIAVGEIGIDLFWDKKRESIQKTVFRKQLMLAKKFRLPVIIHVRDAFNEVFEIVDKVIDNDLFGVFHSFTGSIEDAQKIIDYKNFKIGINGIVTFKNNSILETVKQIDINHIVLETDSPYLAPVPKRGKRNESAYLIHIAQKMSEIKHIDLKELAEITNKNAVEIFGNKLLD
jgi:TatD DNase family protein